MSISRDKTCTTIDKGFQRDLWESYLKQLVGEGERLLRCERNVCCPNQTHQLLRYVVECVTVSYSEKGSQRNSLHTKKNQCSAVPHACAGILFFCCWTVATRRFFYFDMRDTAIPAHLTKPFISHSEGTEK